MPTRPYRLDTGFATPYIPALDTRQEGQKPDTWEDLRDIVTLPFNIRRGADAFSRNRAAFHAAFELENDVINTYDLMTRPTRSPDPDFDIVPRLKQDGLWDNFRDNFIGVFNEADYNDTFARIQREERNKQIAAAAGPVGTLAMVLAGTVSPTVLLPFTGQSRGAIAIGKAIGWGLAGGVLQELPLQLAQETRTFEESALSVATSTVLGGVLGVGMVVHHQDGRRMNCCPLNLVLMPEEMNKVEQRRCPYTGKWLGKDEWAEMYGGDTGEPGWVRSSDW